MRESGAVRVRDRHALGVDRVDVSGRPEPRLPDEVLNDSEIECLADDSGSYGSGSRDCLRVSETITSIDRAPGLDRSLGAYTGPK